jgi:hypothetical protein
MLGDRHAVGHDADLGGRAAHRDRTTGKRRRHAVAIAIQHHEARAGHSQHMLDITVEDPKIAVIWRRTGCSLAKQIAID